MRNEKRIRKMEAKVENLRDKRDGLIYDIEGSIAAGIYTDIIKDSKNLVKVNSKTNKAIFKLERLQKKNKHKNFDTVEEVMA